MLIEENKNIGSTLLNSVEAQSSVYNAFFGFSRSPFSSQNNSDCVFKYSSARNVINTILFCIKTGESACLINGQQGVGKSLLISKAIDLLSDEFYVVQLGNSARLNSRDILMHIIDELGLSYHPELSQCQLRKLVKSSLFAHYSRTDVSIVLWFDDAHLLSDCALAEIKALSEIGTKRKLLLQFIFSGQFADSNAWACPAGQQLLKNINFSEELKSLSFSETKAFVLSRLRAVGGSNKKMMSFFALLYLHKKSQGNPKIISRVLHKSLLLGYGKGIKKINFSFLRSAIKESEILLNQNKNVRFYPAVMFALGFYVCFLLLG